MKILFVQKMNGISGSELYMLQIMPELKRRGYDIEMLIIYPKPGNKNRRFIAYLAEHGIPTHEIYNHSALSPVLFYKFCKIVKKGKYDIVQANLIHADFLAAVTKFFFKRRQSVISVKHGYYPAYQEKYGTDLRKVRYNLYYWVAWFTSRVVNYNITISMGLYRVFTEGGIVGKAPIRNIYYGLTLKEPVEKHIPAAIPEGKYALIVGRLVPFKGHKFLIEAWKKVKAELPGFRLMIAGAGECEAELKKIVADAGLQDVIIFLGHVPNPHPVMQNSEFTLITSTWEGFGLILLESWLHKKSVVAFDVPAMNEVINDNINGLLVPFKNTDVLAEKIIWMYRNPDRAAEMGERGYEKLHTDYTLKRMTDETEEVYNTVYAQSGK